MFRKTMLALSALTVIGAAALVPTAASAGGGWKHHHKHFGWGHGYGYGASYAGYSGYGYGCWVKKWIDTPYGPRLKRIYVCY